MHVLPLRNGIALPFLSRASARTRPEAQAQRATLQPLCADCEETRDLASTVAATH